MAWLAATNERMKSTSKNEWRNTAVVIALIFAVNAAIACLFYETAGWHFLRGYQEVVNFLIYPPILALSLINFVLAIAVLAISQKRVSLRGHLLAASLFACSLLVATSLWFAPYVGRFLNHQLVLKTSLVDAARYGDAPLVRTLIERGAAPNARHPALQTTALHYMAARGEAEVVKLLLANGADPNARAKSSHETPLHAAVTNRASHETISVLVKSGADPRQKDSRGETPIDLAQTIPDPEGDAILRAMGSIRIREAAEPAQH